MWANDASVIDEAIAWDKREKAKAVTAATAAAATDTVAIEDFKIRYICFFRGKRYLYDN